jgi:hypothetical protein
VLPSLAGGASRLQREVCILHRLGRERPPKRALHRSARHRFRRCDRDVALLEAAPTTRPEQRSVIWVAVIVEVVVVRVADPRPHHDSGTDAGVYERRTRLREVSGVIRRFVAYERGRSHTSP